MNLSNTGPSADEVELEQRVAAELEQSLAADRRGDNEAARKHWVAFVDLIRQRSPEQVRRMEVGRGLR